MMDGTLERRERQDLIQRRTLSKLQRLEPGVRRELLRVLTAPDDVRADVIRQFYQRTGGEELAEVLMDLEADELLREQVVLVLRRVSDGGDR